MHGGRCALKDSTAHAHSRSQDRASRRPSGQLQVEMTVPLKVVGHDRAPCARRQGSGPAAWPRLPRRRRGRRFGATRSGESRGPWTLGTPGPKLVPSPPEQKRPRVPGRREPALCPGLLPTNRQSSSPAAVPTARQGSHRERSPSALMELGDDLAGGYPFAAIDFVLGLIERGMESRPILLIEIVGFVHEGQLHLGALGKIHPLIHHDPAVLDVSSQRQGHARSRLPMLTSIHHGAGHGTRSCTKPCAKRRRLVLHRT